MAFGSKSRNNKKTELLNEQKQVLSEASAWPVQEAYKALRTRTAWQKGCPGGS